MNRSPAIVVLVLLAACGGKSPRQQASMPAAPRIAPPYTPPADGRLTERQIDEYLKASRRRAISAGSAPETSAAALGMNPDEYLWVRLKILEARIGIEDAEAGRRNIETYRRTIASLKKVDSVSKDPPTRETLGRQIGELERELSEAERAARRPPLPSDAFNQALVARHRREIETASSRLLEPAR